MLNVALLEVQNDLQYSSPGNLHYDTCEGVGSLSLIIMLILMKGYEHWPSTTCQNWACQIDRWCPVKTEKHKFLCDWSNDPPCRILVWDIRLFERFWSALPTPATICPFIYITEGVVLLLGDLRIYGYLWPKQSSNSSPQARKNGCRFFTSTSSLTGHCYGVWLAASQDRKRQKVMV